MTTPSSDNTNPSDAEKVVMEQTLVKIDEVFVYRIPPMRSVDGHRAEDWNLAKPLATCKLEVLRRDNSLVINIMAERQKPGAPVGAMESYLFAQSNITVDFSKASQKMDHWVVSVIDSSRYFAIRISDPRTGREAFIGVGFRERTDATNFKMSLQDYENSLKREEKAMALQKQFEQSSGGDGGDHASDEGDSSSKLPALVDSKLSLKEGEKIHINIKGGSNKRTGSNRRLRGSGTGGGLKLPPPPPGGTSAAGPGDDESGKETAADTTDVTTDVADDEWGDFEG